MTGTEEVTQLPPGKPEGSDEPTFPDSAFRSGDSNLTGGTNTGNLVVIPQGHQIPLATAHLDAADTASTRKGPLEELAEELQLTES